MLHAPDYHQRITQAVLPQPPVLPIKHGLSAAAVLIPIVHQPSNPDVVLTRRHTGLRQHSGEVAFPGGRVDAADANAQATALREAEEEIGLPLADVQVAGFLEPFATGTGFVIQPVIGFVSPDFTPRPNPEEVAEVFRVPLAFLMDKRNHQRRSGVWRGKRRHFYVMEYKQHYIWGATAAMLHHLAKRAFV